MNKKFNGLYKVINVVQFDCMIFTFVIFYFLTDRVTKLETPFDIYKFDCKDMISNSDAFKLRTALLTMKFKKKSCDLYSFSQSPDFNRIQKDLRPKEVQQFLEILVEIKKKVAAYLKKTFNNTTSVSCSKYDHGGKFFYLILQNIL